MGRSLRWHVLRGDIKHDASKHFCFDWEFQDDKDEVLEQVHDAMCSMKSDDDRRASPLSYNEKQTEKWNSYIDATSEDSVCKWCPKCLMYAVGIYSASVQLDSFDISHSYSNPIWESEWNVRSFHMGSSDTDFVRRFRNDNMYREILPEDVRDLRRRLASLGTPMRKSDREACREAESLLSFLEKWMEGEREGQREGQREGEGEGEGDKDVRIILCDEL